MESTQSKAEASTEGTLTATVQRVCDLLEKLVTDQANMRDWAMQADQRITDLETAVVVEHGNVKTIDAALKGLHDLIKRATQQRKPTEAKGDLN